MQKNRASFFGLAAVWRARGCRRRGLELANGLEGICGTLPRWPIFPMRLCVHRPCMLTFPSSLPFLCLAPFLLPDFLKESASCLVPEKFSSGLIGVALQPNRHRSNDVRKVLGQFWVAFGAGRNRIIGACWEKPAAPPRAWDIKFRHRGGGGAGARPQARQLLLVNTLTGVCPGVTRTGSDGQV